VSGQIEDFSPEWRELQAGIDIAAGRIVSPRLEFWALRIDLSDKNIEIVVNDVVSGEDFPAGTLPAVTVSGFAGKYGCAAAMNAGPFWPATGKAGERRVLTGVFVSSGKPSGLPDARYDGLLFYDDGRAAVLPQREMRGFSGVRHALGGFYTVLRDGRLQERGAVSVKARHPRSVAGVGGGGFTLYLLVIDGRRPGSAGATEWETGILLRALGAEDGLTMDGGGSSAMAAAESGGAVRLVNKPVHGGIPGRERAVASCIGVRSRPLPVR
jgi:exopolysaccharide biosynthesis protein